jgi:hypothetical protein
MNSKLFLFFCFLLPLLASCASTATPTPAPTPTTRTPPPTLRPIAQPTPQITLPTIPTIPTIPTAPTSRLITKLGIHLLIDDHKYHWPQSLWKSHLHYARNLVGEWGYVVVLIRLDELDEVPKWQYFLDLCRELRLTPMVRFTAFRDDVNRWWSAPIRDNEGGGYFTVAEQYRDFLDNLNWPTKPRYIIVGNEPNRGDEWGNEPNGAAYAHFLGDVSKRLREADPNVVILNAALDLYAPHTNGQKFIDGYRYVDADTFINQMVKYDPKIFDKVQIWNSHAYPLDPFRASPDQQLLKFDYLNGAKSARTTPWPSGLVNRGVNAYTWELFKLKEVSGRELPVMITETGWRHRETTLKSLDSHNADLSAAQIADYFELAFIGNRRFSQYATSGWTPWENDSRVLAVMPFALDGYPGEWGHSNWLMVDEQGNIQGVYPMYQRMVELRR